MELRDGEDVGLVVDNGSLFCRAGHIGDDAPRCLVSSVIATSHDQKVNKKKVWDGQEDDTGDSILNYPIERGIIQNWDEMELVWKHVFYDQLHVQTAENPVLLTDGPLSPKTQRERIAEVMFESFSVPAISVVNQAVLCSYSSGKIDCFVVSSGDGITCTYPIYQGYYVPTGVERSEIAGRDLTNFFCKLLSSKGYSFTTTKEIETVRNIKEKFCYNALDYNSELSVTKTSSSLDKTYKLPDGNVISVGEERFMVPESLFQPSLMGSSERGILQMIQDSIEKCDIDMRSSLCKLVVLGGGNTTLPGFKERLQKDITPFAKKGLRVIAPPERRFSAWIGGSILGSLSSFNKMWTLMQEYEEYGPCAVHRKTYTFN